MKFGNKSLGHLGHACGIHCLKTLNKHEVYKNFYTHSKIFWKSGQVLHVNTIYVLNSNSKCTAMFEFYFKAFRGALFARRNWLPVTLYHFLGESLFPWGSHHFLVNLFYKSLIEILSIQIFTHNEVCFSVGFFFLEYFYPDTITRKVAGQV